MNNKGQSLAIFIIFIPIFIMVGVIVIDVYNAKLEARKLDDINKMVIKYGLDHIEEDPYNDMVNLIYKNDDEIDSYKIDIDLDQIKVVMNKTTKGFFGRIIGKEIYTVESNYRGYIENDKKIIEKGVWLDEKTSSEGNFYFFL